MKQQAHLEIEMVSVDELKPYEGNAKIHDNRNVGQIASSIEEFNFADPIAAWHNDKGESVIIEGHGRLLAAQRLGIKELPVIYLDYLTDEQRRAYTIVHNSTTMSTGFDMEALAVELEGLEVDFDMTMFDFDAGVSIDGFGEDFELPDGEAPEFKTVSLHMTAEQYELFEEMQGQVDASGDDGNVAARQVCEVIRQWQAQRM
jgi:hypothetical protein